MWIKPHYGILWCTVRLKYCTIHCFQTPKKWTGLKVWASILDRWSIVVISHHFVTFKVLKSGTSGWLCGPIWEALHYREPPNNKCQYLTNQIKILPSVNTEHLTVEVVVLLLLFNINLFPSSDTQHVFTYSGSIISAFLSTQSLMSVWFCSEGHTPALDPQLAYSRGTSLRFLHKNRTQNRKILFCQLIQIV